MPAQSSSQKHLFSMVKGFKSGALKLSNLPASLADKVKKIASGVSKKSASDFAKTSEKGLPKHVAKEMLDFPALTFKEYMVVESQLQAAFDQLSEYEQNKIIEACSMEDEEKSKKDGKKPKWVEKAEVEAEEKEGKKVSKKEEKKVNEKWESPYKIFKHKKGNGVTK